MADIADRLARLIATSGPISVAQYMAEANAHYYASRDPLGVEGDFTTAPEISQMFGELIGLWLADLWMRAGRPATAHYVELGPGRGTLAEDALRAMRSAGLQPPAELVETSPALRQAQAERVPAARWHDDPATLPGNVPLLIVANEFFDALPVHQWIATEQGWRERTVTLEGDRFLPAAGQPRPDVAVPERLRDARPGSVLETSPASVAVIRELARRIAVQGGAALIIDYGHERTGLGDTLQAVARHAYADPWEAPGTRDLTAHVDFEALEDAAHAEGVRVLGPRDQGDWLKTMGINLRAASLTKAVPEQGADIAAARDRLTLPDQMGTLFKVMALVSRDWPEPEGF